MNFFTHFAQQTGPFLSFPLLFLRILIIVEFLYSSPFTLASGYNQTQSLARAYQQPHSLGIEHLISDQSDFIRVKRFTETFNQIPKVRKRVKRNVHRGHHEGPRFTKSFGTLGDESTNINYYNSSGLVLRCSASGKPSPTIEWYFGSDSDYPRGGSQAGDINGLRYTREDGSLVLLPFSSDQYRQDVHTTAYWCKATNTIGSIISPPFRIKAVTKQNYSLQSSDEFTMIGNAALMTCSVPAAVRDMVRVVYWQRSDGSIITSDSRTSASDFLHLLNDGSLLFEQVKSDDARWKFRCAAKDTLTGELVTSLNWSKIVITESSRDSPPRIIGSPKDAWIEAGKDLKVGCIARSNPSPSYYWIKENKSEANSHHPSPIQSHSPLLLLPKVQIQESGTYTCMVNNSYGKESVSFKLNVYEPMVVNMRPASGIVRRKEGESADLECVIKSGQKDHHLISYDWLKNGRPLMYGSRIKQLSRNKLRLSPLTREDRGMYQCVAMKTSAIKEISIATTQLHIEEEAPILRYTFQSQILEGGHPLSLKCVASGSPLPQIGWKLYDRTLDGRGHRYAFRIGDFVDTSGFIVSFLNISSVSRREGGLYTCEVWNDVGTTSFTAMVSVIGQPMVHPMENVSVVITGKLSLQCPVSGHPIDQIIWKKDGRALPVSHRIQSYSNGTLSIIEAHSEDEGWYQCEVKSGHEMASELVYIRVLAKPVVNPFVFASDLTEGMRARVVCSILSGDHPLEISWYKNGILATKQHSDIDISSITDSDSSLAIKSVKRSHSGNYTCVASSSLQISSNYTAEMIVKAPPRWIIKPIHTYSLLEGRSVVIDCQSDGFPSPNHQWKKVRKFHTFKDFGTGDRATELISIVSGPHIQVLENGSMSIVDVEKDDEGEYLCEANNGVGLPLSVSTHLNVHRPVRFRKNFETIDANQGEDVTLICEPSGDRPIQITWVWDREGQIPFFKTGRFRLEEKPTESGFQSKVIIESVEVSDSTFFTCHGRNTHGSDERSIQLVVRGPPEPPANLRIDSKKSREIKLSWTDSVDGNSPLLGYLVQYSPANSSRTDTLESVSVPPKDLSTIINRLEPETSYQIQIVAYNTLGQSRPSQTILVTTEEEAPSELPGQIQIEALSSHSLKVTWSQIKNNEKIDGYHIGSRRVQSFTSKEDSFSFRTLILNETSRKYEKLDFIVEGLRRNTKYGIVVRAFNKRGGGKLSDEVFGHTTEFDPPENFRIQVNSATHHSLYLSIENLDTENPMTGYMINYRSDVEELEEQKILNNRKTIVLEKLRCGTKYTLSITPYNGAGKSSKSKVIHASTAGNVPSPGTLANLLTMDSTSASINLNAWSDNGCPIMSFVIQYKLHLAEEWISLSNNVMPSQKSVHITDLTPGTWYDLLMIANSEAGSTEEQYLFATLTITGGTVPPISSSSLSYWRELTFSDPVVLAPIVSGFLVLIIILITIFILMSSKNQRSDPSQSPYDSAERRKMESVSMNSFPITSNTSTEGKKIYEMLHKESGYGSYYTSPYPSKRLTFCEMDNLS